jgi:hypothetical protein
LELRFILVIGGVDRFDEAAEFSSEIRLNILNFRGGVFGTFRSKGEGYDGDEPEKTQEAPHSEVLLKVASGDYEGASSRPSVGVRSSNRSDAKLIFCVTSRAFPDGLRRRGRPTEIMQRLSA